MAYLFSNCGSRHANKADDEKTNKQKLITDRPVSVGPQTCCCREHQFFRNATFLASKFPAGPCDEDWQKLMWCWYSKPVYFKTRSGTDFLLETPEFCFVLWELTGCWRHQRTFWRCSVSFFENWLPVGGTIIMFSRCSVSFFVFMFRINKNNSSTTLCSRILVFLKPFSFNSYFLIFPGKEISNVAIPWGSAVWSERAYFSRMDINRTTIRRLSMNISAHSLLWISTEQLYEGDGWKYLRIFDAARVFTLGCL